MKRFILATFVILMCATTAHAQTCDTVKPVSDWVCVNGGWLPPGLAPKPVAPPQDPVGDFALKGTIDWAQVIGANAVISGWEFECRSGLQVLTQRLGVFGAQYKDTIHGTIYSPPSYDIKTIERPDVAAALTPTCPAVGAFVGYGITTPPPPYGSVWEVHIVFRTTDGAGKPLQLDLKGTLDNR